MTDALNILILSCGTRNKIVQYFKKELAGKGQVMATDCSKLAPALYDADRHFIVPRIDEPGYLDSILAICQENSIKGVLSLIDPELSLLAEHKQKFLELGALPLLSDYEVVETCFDKYAMYQFLLQNRFKTVKSYIDPQEFFRELEAGVIDFPVFVKPVRGSASININKAISKEDVEQLFTRYQGLMIQEYMEGPECGADVYVDLLSGEPVAIFTKRKIKMRAGETDKSVSIKDDRLFRLISDLVCKTGLKGVLDLDIFEAHGEYYISEVNPRFGGGYPHAYEVGVNIPRMIINNLRGKTNTPLIGEYPEHTYMMKYNEVKILSD